jgi:plasmid stabilization system protein ParE
MPVIFTAEAAEDLASIRAYIGAESPAAASRVAISIVAACDRLEYLPERGRPGRITGTRELTALWPYVIVYEIHGDQVFIMRIWHGAQDRP